MIWKSMAALVLMAGSLHAQQADPKKPPEPRPTLVAQVGHAGSIHAVALTPDRKLLVTGSADKTAKLWELATGRELRTFTGHGGSVTCVTLVNDGQLLITGSEDRTIRVWDVASGRLLHVFTGHFGKVSGVAVIGGPGQARFWLVSASADRTVRLWDLRTARPIGILDGHAGPVTSLAVLGDGKGIVTGSEDQTARLWDVSTTKEISVLRGHTGSVDAVCVSQDGKWLATGSGDKTARLWDLSTARAERVFAGHNFAVGCLALSADGAWLATGSSPPTRADLLAADASSLLTGGGDANVQLWEVASGNSIRCFEGHNGFVNSVIIDTEGQTLISAGADRTVRLWELGTGKAARVLQGLADPVNSVAISNDGNELMTGVGGQLFETTARCVWDLKAGKQVSVLNEPMKGMRSMANSRGRLISASGDPQVRIWGAEGRELCRLVSFRDGSWAVLDQKGRFDAANNGDVPGLHWVIGNQSFPLRQYRDERYDPGLLAKYLGFEPRPLRTLPKGAGEK